MDMEDTAYELREVVETLNVLDKIVCDVEVSTSCPMGVWQVFIDVLGKQIEKLDSIGLHLSKEHYKPVLLKPKKTEETET